MTREPRIIILQAVIQSAQKWQDSKIIEPMEEYKMENLIPYGWRLGDLILYICLLYYFLQNRKVYSFVKGVFLTCLIFNILSSIFSALLYQFPIQSIRSIFAWGEKLQCIPEYFGNMSYFLILFGITLLFGRQDAIKNEQIEYPEMKGKRRNVGVSLLLFVVTMGIYFPFWLHRTVKDLKNNFGDEIPYTPGKAVGFLFIPVFNIYWTFYLLFSLPLRIKRIEDKYYGKRVGFHFHPILIPILIIIFSVVSNIQFWLRVDKSTFGGLLYCESIIFVLWLTMQAKLNAFFDFKKEH
jgi:hypothetical protein